MDSHPDDRPDNDAQGRWMTFREIAAVRQISVASAVRLVQRKKWRRQADNDSRMRALVPEQWQHKEDSRPDDLPDSRPGESIIIKAFSDALAALQAQQTAEREVSRAAIEVLNTQHDKAIDDLRARQQSERAAWTSMLTEAAAAFEAERARAVLAEAAMEAMRTEQLAEREAWRATIESVREGWKNTTAGLREATDRERARADKAEATVDAERARADAATAEAEAMRERARKAGGFVKRLRAAWRGSD